MRPAPTTHLPDRSGRRIAVAGALLGAFASAYLLVDYVFGSGICLTGSGCDVVRSSALAYPLGIPMPLIGLAFYLVGLVLVLTDPSRLLMGRSVGLIAIAWALAGVAVMTALTLVEAVVIAAWCSWCLLSSVASVVLAAGTVVAERRRSNATPPETGSFRAKRRHATLMEQARHELRRFTAISGGLAIVVFVTLLAIPAMTGAAPPDRLGATATDRPQLGDGPVPVTVFSDFQCPACATAAPLLSTLAEQGQISLTYRYFPLVSIHPNAAEAARAAHAAALQSRFWEFHDALFATQSTWAALSGSAASASFEDIAGRVGLDLARWRSDVESSAVARAVTADAQEAERLGLSGTPTIYVDGRRYDGPLAADALWRAVQEAASAG